MIRPDCPHSSDLDARPDRRRFVLLALGACGCAVMTNGFSDAQDAASPPPKVDVDTAMTKGLTFLHAHRLPDGSFEDGPQKVMTTARALLAFLGGGNVPDLGLYGLTVQDAVKCLLSQAGSDGYLGPARLGVRTHAVATLALSQAYGVDANPDSRSRVLAAIAKAVAVLLAMQNVAKSDPQFIGGWNFERNGADSSLALTASMLLALRACADVGVAVPATAFRRASDFVLRCYDAGGGAFGPEPGKPATRGATAAGVIALFASDAAAANADKLDAAGRSLAAPPPAGRGPDVTAGAGTAGGAVALAALRLGPQTFADVGRPALHRIARSQEKDGGWPAPAAQTGGAPQQPLTRIGVAAQALQALTIARQVLPIYQR